MRRACAAFVIVVSSVLAAAQEPRPAFEVASVKRQSGVIAPSGPGRSGSADAPTGIPSVFRMRNATVEWLVRFAYDLQDFQLSGGPDWVRTDRFEIMATPNADGPTARLMMRALLEDRFKLVVQHQPRQMKSYALVLARKDGRLGDGLKRCDDPNLPRPSTPVRVPAGSIGGPINAWCGTLEPIRLTAQGLMKAIVVDKTALEGKWTYSFFVAAPTPPPPGPVRDQAETENLATLPVALQEQLGLKLEEVRGPVDTVVIESVQPPTEN
jgi:uncharacterized protein (TIGR03435 family)